MISSESLGLRDLRPPAGADELDSFMAQRSLPSPKFDDPPVVETVMGIHFRPLRAFTIAQRSLFWSQFKANFPNVEEKAPLDEVREEFGAEPKVRPEIRWELSDQPPSPRLWCKSPDGRHTIQIQHNALLVNWERDPERRQPYWGYDQRRADYAEKLNALDQFLHNNAIGHIEPTSCFVTYVNHIEVGALTDFAPQLQRVLTVWRNETGDGWLPSPERAILQFSFVMPDAQGRLHVRALPALRHRDKNFIIRFDLTARGSPREPTIDAALAWLDLGHEWVVRGFVSLTEPDMHAEWGKTQ